MLIPKVLVLVIFSNSERRIKYVSLHNQPCQARPTLVDINSNKPLFYTFPVSVNNYGGKFNTIDDPHTIDVPDRVKNMNVKVFNLMPGENETKLLVQHNSFEY